MVLSVGRNICNNVTDASILLSTINNLQLEAPLTGPKTIAQYFSSAG